MALSASESEALLRVRMDRMRAEMAIPGAVARILRHGEVVADLSWGERWIGGPAPDSHSVFRIASMTKSFTAAAVLLLRDRGLLRLDDEVSGFVPVAQVDGPRITIRDLLTMNAGLPTDDPWGDRGEDMPIDHFAALVADGLRFVHPPRLGFEYSNAGYAVLGLVIEKASGRRYLDFVTDEILRPLGMDRSTFFAREIDARNVVVGHAELTAGLTPLAPVDPGAFSPMGGLHSTIDDLTVWVRGFMADTNHPLSWWSRQEMQQPMNLARVTSGDEFAVSASYGFGLLSDDHTSLGRFVHHSGGYPGFGSHMRWHAKSGWAVILLANRTYANMRRVGEETMCDLVGADPGIRELDLWPETRAAMEVCEQLLTSWDDALADEWFAHNVDLDRPRAERREMWRAAGEGLGQFTRGAMTSQTPAHVRWTICGDSGEVDLELLMSPESSPALQALSASRR